MSETKLDEFFTKEQVENVSEKILASVRDKVKRQIGDALYNELSDVLYEHYDNAQNKIKTKLIFEITEQYVKNPQEYRYQNLRKKMWEENKDELTKTLTDEAIKESVEKVILDYTQKNYYFNWQWKDGIVKLILKNWDKFKDDERIMVAFGRELENKQNYIKNLERKLNEK